MQKGVLLGYDETGFIDIVSYCTFPFIALAPLGFKKGMDVKSCFSSSLSLIFYAILTSNNSRKACKLNRRLEERRRVTASNFLLLKTLSLDYSNEHWMVAS